MEEGTVKMCVHRMGGVCGMNDCANGTLVMMET
jgi:hypothetical protein